MSSFVWSAPVRAPLCRFQRLPDAHIRCGADSASCLPARRFAHAYSWTGGTAGCWIPHDRTHSPVPCGFLVLHTHDAGSE